MLSCVGSREIIQFYYVRYGNVELGCYSSGSSVLDFFTVSGNRMVLVEKFLHN